jgi:hypothetical protein
MYELFWHYGLDKRNVHDIQTLLFLVSTAYLMSDFTILYFVRISFDLVCL